MRRCPAGVIAGAALIAVFASPDAGHAASSAVAPGAPGAAATWAPADKHGFGTSATPLAWSHAQYVRLAWSITAGHPVEQPSIVACRYVRSCT